jgi:hypothetical protein
MISGLFPARDAGRPEERQKNTRMLLQPIRLY